MCDGAGYTRKVVESVFRQKPLAIITAESDFALRKFVAQKWGYSVEQNWVYDHTGTPSIYVDDVWAILADNAKILKELLYIIGPDADKRVSIIIIGGSPCQDLTYAGSTSILGVTGERSRHVNVFYAFNALLLAIKIIRPDLCLRTYPVIENAGSMKDYHKLFILQSLGIAKSQVHLTKAGDSGYAKRDQYFFSRLKSDLIPEPKNDLNHGMMAGSFCRAQLPGLG